MKKKRNTKVSSIIYESIFAILALVVVSYAWFAFSNQASTTGIDLEVIGAIDISISNDGKNWSKSTSISPQDKMALSELSGDGINLFYPVIANKQVQGYTNVSEFSQTDVSYLEFKFYISSSGPVSIYYGVDCSVVPLDNSKLADNIAGAIRVACFETTGGKQPTSSIVWAPNSTYQYSNGAVNKSGTVEDQYTYATSSSTTLKTISTNGAVSGISTDKKFIWGNITEQMIADMDPITTINTEYGEEASVELTVRIWVEGTDREAVRELLGGQFKVHLSFKAGDVDEE